MLGLTVRGDPQVPNHPRPARSGAHDAIWAVSAALEARFAARKAACRHALEQYLTGRPKRCWRIGRGHQAHFTLV